MEPTADDAILTAYLDGELDAPDRHSLEHRLAQEPDLRKNLTLLETTWNYLGLLEKEEADAEKIETTLKIAALSLSTSLPKIDPLKQKPINGSATILTWSATVFIGLVFFLLFLHVGLQSSLESPSFRRKIERLDLYFALSNENDSLELLQNLAFHRVFLPLHQSTDTPDFQADIRQYKPKWHRIISNMFSNAVNMYRHQTHHAELQQLFYKNIQTYDLLSQEKIAQIQTLHQAIEASPRQAELLLTLQNYHHWKQNLQSYERIALRQPKPMDEKVLDIKELRSRLEESIPETTAWMPSEIVSIQESKSLAAVLENLPFGYQERLLEAEPFQIINELRQR